MTVTGEDLGVLGNLAEALGIFEDGVPNSDWFGRPDHYLSRMLSDDGQRQALVAFIDEVLGGSEAIRAPGGRTWLPVIELRPPDPDLKICLVIDDQAAGETAQPVRVGLGLVMHTAAPVESDTTVEIPLFQVDGNGVTVTEPFLLGRAGGRIRIGTSVVVGEPTIQAIGLDVDVPTSTADDPAVFGLALTGLQLPGAPAPRDVRVSADDADQLDDAVLDLVLSVVRSLVDDPSADPRLTSLAGMLGLVPGDPLPDFPIVEVADRGPVALTAWLHALLTQEAQRAAWVGYLAGLFGVTAADDEVVFPVPGTSVSLRVGVRVDAGASGHAQVTPTLGMELTEGGTTARVEARVDLCTVDLVTGAATAVPRLGIWAALGGRTAPVLDQPAAAPVPAVRAERLRLGFALDGRRRPTFVLAADEVAIGSQQYAVLDLTSPDALTELVGAAASETVDGIAEELLGGLAPTVEALLGIGNAPGMSAPVIPLTELALDPVGRLAEHWRVMLADHRGDVLVALEALRSALSDAATTAVDGSGSTSDPWRLGLAGPVALHLWSEGDRLLVDLAVSTTVDDLGGNAPVIEGRIGARLAEVDLAARSARLLTGVDARLGARLPGATPAQARLTIAEDLALTASYAGLRLGWTPEHGLVAATDFPGLSLEMPGDTVPVALPRIGTDGTVALPAEGWDLLQQLAGHLEGYLPETVRRLTDLLGWTGRGGADAPVLRLAALVVDPATALEEWAAGLAVSDLAPSALAFLADLLTAAEGRSGLLQGSGHPDDPYRLRLSPTVPLPELAVWFPPQGLRPRLVNVPEQVRTWFPGQRGLAADALARALEMEAEVAPEVADLIEGRDVAEGLRRISLRWKDTDGRILSPLSPPAGVTRVLRFDVAAGQLLDELLLEHELARTPTAVVHVGLGTEAWADKPPARVLDLTAPGLQPSMFTAPEPDRGDWFVRLGTRVACRLATGDPDGTIGQAARLRVVLDRLASLGSDLVVVGVGGAGHACREAAAGQPAVSELVTLGTPYGPVSLAALTTAPEADGLRLLHRMLPPLPADGSREDADLRLARGLVASLMDLVQLDSPEADLRPAASPPAPRTGLETTAIFGVVTEEQVSRAVTAAVVAGLAHRARTRATTPLPPPTGVRAGVRFALPDSGGGSLRVRGHAVLSLVGLDVATETQPARVTTARGLRVHAAVSDRLGFLLATPQAELRKVTADAEIPLGGAGSSGGTGRIVLHDARVLGRSWERLVVEPDSALVPEARTLLAVAFQRLREAAAGPAAATLAELLEALGITVEGAAAFDAVDQLVRDPVGLLRGRLQTAGPALAAAVSPAVGAPGVDLATGTVRLQHTSTAGLFGWTADVTAGPSGLAGSVAFGPSAPGPGGALRLLVSLAPYTVRLSWTHPGGGTDLAELWPHPDPGALARSLVDAVPSLAGHVAVEILRDLDPDLRPLVDAVLDALGLLSGAATDAERRLRPLAGLIADPAGWLRSADSVGASAAGLQALLDALRPLTGIAGVAGGPWQLADGVELAVTGEGAGARVSLALDSSRWTPTGSGMTGGATASLLLLPSGPPTVALDAFLGPGDGADGRGAVHVELGTGSPRVFYRPTTGADVALVPFAGLGGLAQAATYALPLLLDLLADGSAVGSVVGSVVGDVVATVGDALALRSAGPDPRFQHDRLAAWATDPGAALQNAVPRLVDHLAQLAGHADAFTPAAVTVGHAEGTLTATARGVTLAWRPSDREVALWGAGLAVPGVERLTFRLAVSDQGLEDLTVTVGPARIDAGDVTLRPFVTVAGGSAPVGGRRVLVGLAASDTARFAARWTLEPTVAFDLVGSDGPISLEAPTLDDPARAALRAVEVVADLVAAIAMSTSAVQDLLGKTVFSSSVHDLLKGVVLEDQATPELIGGLFDAGQVPARVRRLFENVAGAGVEIVVDGQLTLRLLTDSSQVLGLQVEVDGRWALLEDDICLWLENDDSWIDGDPPGNGGVFIGFLDLSPAVREFRPTLTVWGVGLRIGRASGPLLDVGLTLESVALHVFGDIGAGVPGRLSGGAQVQLTNLAVSAAGAQGGNGIAAGIVRDTGSTPPRPAFSPAVSVQKHGTDAVSVMLRAGDGDGPWWLAVQQGFGPLYLEQVGLGVELRNQRVDEVSVFLDGSVSLFGLTCAVDDLQITYLVTRNDLFDPTAWDIDLAGLAVSADLAGVSVAGGLLKHEQGTRIEYLGMLLARFGVYGITIYGGYGEDVDLVTDERFVGFFAVGSVVGPIGGPPAFFLTGIGGGFGINRELVVPTDLATFGEHPLIKALDVAAAPGNPMAELRRLGEHFPMKRGNFWFAAGVSFTSFALVDGIAVVTAEVGDGLDVSLLGLARMALPRPQVALVSIEIALLARLSTSEGVLWVQGQLTDNSWLLHRDVRLTGGFAFVTWFKGEHRGELVLTIGGFHPDFSRDGYPVVPRVGMRWQVGSDIVIQAGGYFALTSEALMTGGDFSASARFGWAWAELAFGAHGIVFFDPFSYDVMAYARVDAGVSVDIWPFGEVSFSVHVGARIEVEGPDFHGRAAIEVGPCEVEVEFGGSQHRTPPLTADVFVEKYLEAAPGGAVVSSVVVSFGAAPSGAGDPTPDGTAQRPFKVGPEFGLIVTTTVPITALDPAPPPGHPVPAPSHALGVAPMDRGSLALTLAQSWQDGDSGDDFPFALVPGRTSAFPVGVWGPPQDENNRRLPRGEVIEALSEVVVEAWGQASPPGPEIAYHDVETNRRIPLPFARTAEDVAELKQEALDLAGVVGSQPTDAETAFARTEAFLRRTASPSALAALRGERQAPPRLGSLGEGLDADAFTVAPAPQDEPAVEVVDSDVAAPVVVGLLHAGTPVVNALRPSGTTVADVARLWRTAPPTLAAVDAARSRSIAATLVTIDTAATPVVEGRDEPRVRPVERDGLARAAARTKGTVLPTGAAPPTALARGPLAQVARAGGSSSARLTAFAAAMTAGRRVPGDPGAVLDPGDVAVLKLPNSRHDVGTATPEHRPTLLVEGAPARVLALGPGGGVLADSVATEDAAAVPRGTERLVAIGLGGDAPVSTGLDGWHAGALLPYLGWSTALGRGCLVRSRGDAIRAHAERADAGWVTGAELARGVATVTTRFTGSARTVVVVVDDPTAMGGDAPGRRLVLGLDGAERVTDARGEPVPPVLLASENRSVLAYAIAPTGAGPVVVTVASEQGWSLVGVLAARDLGPEGAVSLVAARGLDAALNPLAPGTAGTSRLTWQAPPGPVDASGPTPRRT